MPEPTTETHMHWTIKRDRYTAEHTPPEAPGMYITIGVMTDQPMIGADPAPRHGNRYYPSFVSIDVGDDGWSVLSCTAREIARSLIDAANRADNIDREDGLRDAK